VWALGICDQETGIRHDLETPVVEQRQRHHELGIVQDQRPPTGAASNPDLASDLQAQSATTQHDVRTYLKVYPVLSFGVGYRF